MTEHTQPSAPAVRAAEAVKQQFAIYCIPQHPTDLEPDSPDANELAEIIERETGAGEAHELIESLLSNISTDAPLHYTRQARAFLARFNRD